ncbi:L-lactate dehydrogenase [Clostridium sp.]|uniref:L-lactate dehydrogenase n=1 Tax=Clostridium sp. TaxID=1506 RepID=UPI003463E5EE
MIKEATKVSIIGAGFVGSTTAYALMLEGLVSDLIIVDINRDKAEAEAMDLSHGAAFVKATDVKAGDYEDTKNSDIIIITAGVGPKPGETRLDIVKKNYNIFKTIVPEVVKYSPNAILLVVSNPVDVLTYITYKLSGLPSNRVIGSGTVLDTSRFKYSLSDKFSVDARNIHTYIIGEHGDSEMAAWSLTSIAGMGAEEFCLAQGGICDEEFKKATLDEVKNAAYEIINRKGYTNYAVALAVRRIVEAIIRDEKSILTISSLFQGQYGIEGMYLGIPTVVGIEGAEKVLNVPLNEEEINGLRKSADVLKESIKDLEF